MNYLNLNIDNAGNSLEKALRSIGREDIVDQCIFNVELVTDDLEKAAAKMQLDAQHPADAGSAGIGPAHSSLRRNTSLDVSFDEQDLMKVGYIDHVDIIFVSVFLKNIQIDFLPFFSLFITKK